ncbi:MAG: hypothetical protein GY795_31280 [Desulfobacterales bacterium]|nr:hypothetical protein [Desulfobacterales bacterium]
MMKWLEIRKQHPGKFILLGDIVKEKITDTKFRILEGRILKVSDDPKEIRNDYQICKKKGMNVIYSLPNTPQDFIVEHVFFAGILK